MKLAQYFLLGAFAFDISHCSIEWTSISEAGKKGSSSSAPAFRDALLESVVRNAFDKFMSGPDARDLLPEPLFLEEEVDSVQQSSAYDVQFRARGLMLTGLRALEMTFLRIVRHYGLGRYQCRDVYGNANWL